MGDVMVIRALSIDGGGIRGIIPATILGAIETATGKQTYELFDVIVGTSTGGILSLGLTCPQPNGRPQSALELRSLYLDRGSTIFPLGGAPLVGVPGDVKTAIFGVRTPLPDNASLSDRFKHFMGFQNVAKVAAVTGPPTAQGNARYPAAPLEAELSRQFGEVHLSQALRPVCVVSCDLSDAQPLLFLGGGLPPGQLGDTQMRHAARATSAGPTFFPPLTYTDTEKVRHQCVDGGLVANDPSLVAVTIAKVLRNPVSEPMTLLSIGTGESSEPEYSDQAQLVGRGAWTTLLKPLMACLSTAPGALTRYLLSVQPDIDYTRLQPELGFGAVHAMDNVTPANTDALLKTAEAFVQTQASKLRRIAASLAQ
jgi:uncharacterized protein